MHKQAKSNYAMQKVQPKIQALKDRFPDDPTRQSQEMQKIYAEMKFNPLAGCLPMLLQMPIFIALFQVLREMGDRIGEGTYSFYNFYTLSITKRKITRQALGGFKYEPEYSKHKCSKCKRSKQHVLLPVRPSAPPSSSSFLRKPWCCCSLL